MVTYSHPQTPVPGNSTASSRHQAHIWCTNTDSGKTHINIKFGAEEKLYTLLAYFETCRMGHSALEYSLHLWTGNSSLRDLLDEQWQTHLLNKWNHSLSPCKDSINSPAMRYAHLHSTSLGEVKLKYHLVGINVLTVGTENGQCWESYLLLFRHRTSTTRTAPTPPRASTSTGTAPIRR